MASLDLAPLFDQLSREYADVSTPNVVARSLQSAAAGLRLFGFTDGSSLHLVERMARQEIELTAGIVEDRTYLDGRPRRAQGAA